MAAVADLVTIKERILNYTLDISPVDGQDYTRILLQCFGYAGHGKSSLINSFIYALKGGEFQTRAQVAPAENYRGGMTTVRNSFTLTDTITAVDNRGFGKMDDYETGEIYAQLANVLPLDEYVNWEEKSFEKYVQKVVGVEMNYTDMIVPIYVYSVENGLEAKRAKEIQTFLKNAQKMTGILPIIVLTKKTTGSSRTVCEKFKDLGMETIFEVENYTSQDHVRTPGKDMQFLCIIQKALDLVEFRRKEAYSPNPKKDHNERLTMLLKMANERAIADAIEAKEKEMRQKENQQQTKPPARKRWWWFW